MGRVCPSWLSFMLYNPIRNSLTDRMRILDDSGVTAESVVLEVGAGNGFLTEVLAERARRVIAVELQPGMVKKLQKRIGRFGDKVEIRMGDIAVEELEDLSADICLLYYCFHEVSRQADAARAIARALRQDGILAIYEPTIEVRKKAMEETVELFVRNGFQREQESGTLFTRFARLRRNPSNPQ